MNLENAADRRHLRDDAITAEMWHSLADNTLDICRSGTIDAMNACRRVQGVASQHRVDVALVDQYRFDRNIVLGFSGDLRFGVLYAFVAYGLDGQIQRRFPPDEWFPSDMTLILSLG